MKICLRGASRPAKLPVSAIRDIVLKENSNPEKIGSLIPEDIKPAYYGFFASFAELKNHHFSLIIDTANAMGVPELPIYEQFFENLSMIRLYDDLAHPLLGTCYFVPFKTETLDELQARVLTEKADLGIVL